MPANIFWFEIHAAQKEKRHSTFSNQPLAFFPPLATCLYIIFRSVSAISDGVAATPMPAFRKAAIFAAAVPLPPLMMAPAWPIRRPAGAVAPAMNPATGFLQ